MKPGVIKIVSQVVAQCLCCKNWAAVVTTGISLRGSRCMEGLCWAPYTGRFERATFTREVLETTSLSSLIPTPSQPLKICSDPHQRDLQPSRNAV